MGIFDSCCASVSVTKLVDRMTLASEAHSYMGLQEVAGHHVNPAGEWLLDNFHIALALLTPRRLCAI
jgi:hypothetical protein